MELVKVNPEAMDVANVYLQNLNIGDTARQMGLTESETSSILDAAPIKRYIDSVFMDTGYRNKHKLAAVLDKMIDAKLEEAEETEIYTNKDLLDLLKFAHEIGKDNAKPEKQTNVQINNYGKLMEDLAR